MAHSDPNHPRSKEPTTPRRSSPAPTTGKDIKSGKKLEPAVIVAIISAATTLVAALLSSPVMLALINKTPTGVSSAAELDISGTLLPENTQADVLPDITYTPSESGLTEVVSSPTFAPTNEPESTPASTQGIALIETATSLPPTPENTAIPTQAIAASLFHCLSADLWNPYPASLNPGISNGCWNLSDWGFTTEKEQLFLIHTPAQDQQRGIYIPISGDVDVHFTLQMNEFRTHSNKGAFLHFGIVQDDPFSNFAGGFLSYQQPTPGAGSPVRILVSGNNQATQTIMALETDFQQEVLLSVEGDLLTVFLNDEPVGEPVGLPHTDRAFWIGYVLP